MALPPSQEATAATTDEYCRVCGQSSEDIDNWGICPLNDDPYSADDWETDHCLDLILWWRELDERAAALLAEGKLPPTGQEDAR